ncbi:MAG: hypothetical protein RLZZ621_1481 [Gemmatimonadota bacterium]|jgi:hypothetical protein
MIALLSQSPYGIPILGCVVGREDLFASHIHPIALFCIEQRQQLDHLGFMGGSHRSACHGHANAPSLDDENVAWAQAGNAA